MKCTDCGLSPAMVSVLKHEENGSVVSVALCGVCLRRRWRVMEAEILVLKDKIKALGEGQVFMGVSGG